ncbi:MAG: hypothetical protein PHX15_00775 [Candidatus Nanoarchaeia archaeon]|jgi:flagellar motor component MotA|nr:hypothetical protein [Candidatus Nanoarchaeia archaeon]MDD3993713.1 hypothetical protein [Candidatus Nanoarchaeia archaeon]MDD4563746.1 hypothetical protein [Candidatus Nanoarchaeia archaeon]
MVKSRENLIGAYAFLAGVILAVILGLFDKALSGMYTIIYTTLVILGLIVGFLNTGDKDTKTFLFASVSLIIVGGLGNNTLIFMSNLSPVLATLKNISSALLVLFIPATIIVVIKTVFSIAKV